MRAELVEKQKLGKELVIRLECLCGGRGGSLREKQGGAAANLKETR